MFVNRHVEIKIKGDGVPKRVYKGSGSKTDEYQAYVLYEQFLIQKRK